MAEITITIPDGVVQRVLDALCGQFGWTPESGLTQGQFAKWCVARWAKDVVRTWEAQQASEAAILAAQQDVDTDIVIT
jgi:hypothetical protein